MSKGTSDSMINLLLTRANVFMLNPTVTVLALKPDN